MILRFVITLQPSGCCLSYPDSAHNKKTNAGKNRGKHLFSGIMSFEISKNYKRGHT